MAAVSQRATPGCGLVERVRDRDMVVQKGREGECFEMTFRNAGLRAIELCATAVHAVLLNVLDLVPRPERDCEELRGVLGEL